MESKLVQVVGLGALTRTDGDARVTGEEKEGVERDIRYGCGNNLVSGRMMRVG